MKSHHPYRKQKEDEKSKMAREFFGAVELQHMPTSYEDILDEKYPDVPRHIRQVWDSSDTELPQSLEWMHQTSHTATVLERAADACRNISKQGIRTTPSKLKATTNVLLQAVHKTEALIMELSLNYPFPKENCYSLVVADPELFQYAPKLLYCNESEFILWIPRLPSRQRASSSVIFLETEAFLRNAALPRLQNWHADFIHCFHPDHIVGVRDVDNYDLKPIIDALARAMYSKDSYEHFSCSMYNLANAELQPGCYIYVSKRDEKVRFLQNFISKASGSETR